MPSTGNGVRTRGYIRKNCRFQDFPDVRGGPACQPSALPLLAEPFVPKQEGKGQLDHQTRNDGHCLLEPPIFHTGLRTGSTSVLSNKNHCLSTYISHSGRSVLTTIRAYTWFQALNPSFQWILEKGKV